MPLSVGITLESKASLLIIFGFFVGFFVGLFFVGLRVGLFGTGNRLRIHNTSAPEEKRQMKNVP
jgi:hypothetical protein